MKKFSLRGLAFVLFFWGMSGHAAVELAQPAFKADHLKGAYEVLSQSSSRTAKAKVYFILDTDTLLNIWTKYADSPLPDNLQSLKDEPSIIVGLNDGSFVMLSLERNAMIGTGFLRMADNAAQVELARQPDGHFALGILKGQSLSRYVLAPAQPL